MRFCCRFIEKPFLRTARWGNDIPFLGAAAGLSQRDPLHPGSDKRTAMFEPLRFKQKPTDRITSRNMSAAFASIVNIEQSAVLSTGRTGTDELSNGAGRVVQSTHAPAPAPERASAFKEFNIEE